MAEDNMDVTPSGAEDVVQPQEQIEAQSQSPEPTEQAKEISDKEINFQRMREKLQRLEQENQEFKQYITQATPKNSPPEEDELGLEDDDIPDGRLVKKLYKQIETLKKTYEADKQATLPERLKTKFQDFDQVVTKENLEKLQHTEPEVYASIISGKDLYSKSVSAYKTLKALGIVKDDPYVQDKERVHQNQTRPLSAQAIRGQGALSEANVFAKGLTPELKKQLQQEMEQAVKAR